MQRRGPYERPLGLETRPATGSCVRGTIHPATAAQPAPRTGASMYHQYDKSSKWFDPALWRFDLTGWAGVRDFFGHGSPWRQELVPVRDGWPDGADRGAATGANGARPLHSGNLLPIQRPASPPQVCVRRGAGVSRSRRTARGSLFCSSIPGAGSRPLRPPACASPRGLTNWRLSWKIAKLWEVPALELLGGGRRRSHPLGAAHPIRRARPSRSCASCVAP